jgi:hypothetical protein
VVLRIESTLEEVPSAAGKMSAVVLSAVVAVALFLKWMLPFRRLHSIELRKKFKILIIQSRY